MYFNWVYYYTLIFCVFSLVFVLSAAMLSFFEWNGDWEKNKSINFWLYVWTIFSWFYFSLKWWRFIKKTPENPSLNTFCCYQKASFHYINNHFQFSLMSLFQFSIQSKQENFLHTHIGLLCNIHKFRCKDFERGLMLKKYCTIGWYSFWRSKYIWAIRFKTIGWVKKVILSPNLSV